MGQGWTAVIHPLVRRGRGWIGGGFDYRSAYRKANLDREHWKVVGTQTKVEFELLGRGKRQLLIDRGLTPEGRVLDVGCGTGLLTAALADYLSPSGLYHGTDIAPEAIAFCRRTFRQPNFFFHQNGLTRLPIAGIEFDFVFFGSVWTHVFPREIRALTVDVVRLLAPNGQIIADAFVDPGVKVSRGDRGMVVLNETILGRMVVDAGLQLDVFMDAPCRPEIQKPYQSWPCGPDTRRLMFTLKRTATPLSRVLGA